MYNIIIYIYLFGVAIASLFNKKVKKMWQGEREAFDVLRSKVDPNAQYVWFHAASLGEFEQGRPIMERLRKEHLEYKILLTFFSPSGYEVRKNYEGADIICYLPLDTPLNARRFLRTIRPVMAFFIKYEFWYNYLTQLKKKGIETYIVSAIFRKDQVFFKPYGGLFRKMLKSFTALFVQDDLSLQLLKEIGITSNVTICGDTRFDRVNQITAASKEFPAISKFSGNSFTILAGSTWPPDEEILAASVKNFSKVKLVIAPHEIHKEHISKIMEIFKGYNVVKFSDCGEIDDAALQQANVLVVDCMGILSSIYRYGNFAYIGGGFGVGIHNILEAATYGIPVAFGPKYQKFKEARDLVARQGATSVRSQEEFYSLLDKLVKNRNVVEERGKICLNYVQENLGATKKIISIIENISF